MSDEIGLKEPFIGYLYYATENMWEHLNLEIIEHFNEMLKGILDKGYDIGLWSEHFNKLLDDNIIESYIGIDGKSYTVLGSVFLDLPPVFPKKYKRAKMSKSKRFKILKRDNFRCIYCGESPNNGETILHIDHKIPLAKGGDNKIDNLVTSCNECNLGKGVTIL